MSNLLMENMITSGRFRRMDETRREIRTFNKNETTRIFTDKRKQTLKIKNNIREKNDRARGDEKVIKELKI